MLIVVLYEKHVLQACDIVTKDPFSFRFPNSQVNQKEENVQVMTFGQPRIGNAIFATYYSEIVPNTIRVTNGNDVVPHLPPYYTYFPQKTYHHFPREVFLAT